MMSRWRSRCLMLILVSGTGCCAMAQGPDAKAVFEKVAPGVALVKDLESHGSGVVLDAAGTLLTSFHVVQTPLPLEVTAEVLQDGRRRMMTFRDVTIVSVHKTYDLAIVRVKLPAGVRTIPVTRAARTVQTGEASFVIGNPGGAGGEALRNTITAGIVSAAERVLDNQRYIQTTAAINPGNSGGALVDARGELLGIIAFIITDTEGIGFAIPSYGLQSAEFVPPAERKDNVEEANRLERLGSLWYSRAAFLRGEARDVALALAYLAYRQSITEAPNSASAYNNLGNVYVHLNEFEKARYFFKRASELDGEKDPLYLKMRGVCEHRIGNEREAVSLWKKAVDCSRDDAIRSECAENLAVSALNVNRQAEAAYLVRWANVLAPPRPDRAAARSQLYQEAVNALSDAEYQHLEAKLADFSFTDMDAFAAKRIAVVSRPAQPPAAVRGKTPPAATEPVAVSHAFKAALAGAPEPPPEGLLKKIPESVADCQPAYGGVYLIMKFREMKKLGVFNIAQARFDTYIPLADPDSLFAAGGTSLVVYDPGQKLFHHYNMTNFEKIGTRMSRLQGVLTFMTMGLLTSDRAVVSWAVGQGSLDERMYGLLDLATMQVTPFRSEGGGNAQGFRHGFYRDQVHIRLNHRSTRFVAWCTSHSPSGFLAGTINGSSVESVYEHESPGSLSMLPDASRIVGSSGKILDAKGGTVHAFTDHGSVLFAVDGANMVIKVNGKAAVLVDARNFSELNSFTLPFGMKASNWNRDNFTTDRQAFASAYLNRAVFIDNSAQQVAIFKLPGTVDTDALAGQLQGVKAGTAWTHRLAYPAGTKIAVEDAPAGVRFDPATMTLSWSIPADHPSGSQLILLSVVTPDKGEVYEKVMVPVR